MAERRTALDRIADRCNMPRTSWKLVDETRVTLQVPPDTKYDSADCLITEFQRSKLPLQLGFVGHEYYAEENR